MTNRVSEYCALLLIFSGLALSSCATKQEPAPPSYPSVSEISPIPEYPESAQDWNSDAACWVSSKDYTCWQWDPAVIQTLMREELRGIGYKVKEFDHDYVTREERLNIHKLIFLKNCELKKTMTQEGMCFDIKLTVDIINNPDFDQSTSCDIWGRSVISPGQVELFEDIIKGCVKNMRYAPEFREALELTPPAPVSPTQ